MMAAGKVSKFAEGVPSLKLNLKKKFGEKNKMKISHNKFSLTSLSLLLPFLHILFFPNFSPFHVIYEDGIIVTITGRLCTLKVQIMRWGLD